MNKKNVLQQLRIIARTKKEKDLFFSCILKNVGEILKELRKSEESISKSIKGLDEICKGNRTKSDNWFFRIKNVKRLEIWHEKCSCGSLNHYGYDWDTGEYFVVDNKDITCPECKETICSDCKK